jgi:hypothetical protein
MSEPPDKIAAVIHWAREQEGMGGLLGAHINAPQGLTLGEAFKILADCAAAGFNAYARGVLDNTMLDDPPIP